MSEKEKRSSERWSKALQKARQSQSLRQLIEFKDAPLRIAQAPIPELYFAINEAGLADASEVLEYITPLQFQGFIDLGAWRGDRLSIEACAEWLGAIAQISKEKLQQLVTQTDEWRPVAVGLTKFVSSDAPNSVHLQMAAGVLMIIPILALYFFTQRQFVEGISSSGLKG